jgi:hypothetical protein
MRTVLLLVAMSASVSTGVSANIAAMHAAPPTVARIQPDIVCMDPDMEFPVACDDEE